MLATAHARGVEAALAHYKIAGWLGNVASGLIGTPGRVFVQGRNAFRGNGLLSAKNVFWPAVSGPGGSKLNWLNRANTAMMPLQMMGEMREDNGESGLTKALGAAGSIAGSAYGYPALGALGSPLVSGVGRRIGHGIGHLVSGPPKDPNAV